jgi:hypothetical protein
MPADSFVGIWKCIARPNLCETPACVKPPPRCATPVDTVAHFASEKKEGFDSFVKKTIFAT